MNSNATIIEKYYHNWQETSKNNYVERSFTLGEMFIKRQEELSVSPVKKASNAHPGEKAKIIKPVIKEEVQEEEIDYDKYLILASDEELINFYHLTPDSVYYACDMHVIKSIRNYFELMGENIYEGDKKALYSVKKDL